MEDLFRSYWWLLFPMAWFVFGGFSSFLNYRRQKETLKLIRAYAERGEPPPEGLLKVLDQPVDDSRDYGPGRSGGRDGHWFSFVFFGIAAVGFAYGAYTDMYGAGPALVIVTFVLAGLSAASLVSALRQGRRRGD